MHMTKLVKATYDRKIAGVCGGIAQYFNVDPTAVRVGYALISLISGLVPGIIVYILLAVIMPER